MNNTGSESLKVMTREFEYSRRFRKFNIYIHTQVQLCPRRGTWSCAKLLVRQLMDFDGVVSIHVKWKEPFRGFQPIFKNIRSYSSLTCLQLYRQYRRCCIVVSGLSSLRGIKEAYTCSWLTQNCSIDLLR